MSKKVIALTLILFLGFAGVNLVAEVQAEDSDTFNFVTIGNQDTMDPHYSYDTSSGEVIFQVYENLIAYKGESVREFEPLLAKEVPSQDNGLISEDGMEYTFELREGIKFSNGNELTPEDVKYSFIRGMIFDRTGGPVWMLYEPLLDMGSLSDLTQEVVGVEDPNDLTAEESAQVYDKLDETISIEGNKITFHLAKPYPPFLNIVAQGASWASILDKEWSIEQGAWDGSPETIADYHDPEKEDDPLYDKMMGTGPFILQEWENNEHVILNRNDDYWREPANFETAIIRSIDEFSTRKLMLERGDADMIYVPPAQVSQFEGREEIAVDTGIPALQSTVGVMTWEIDTSGNDYVGSGELDGNGIPADFFSDRDVRKGFSYCFNYKAFIDEAADGHGQQGRGPIPEPLLGFNEDSEVYELNLDKAEEHFQQAFDGELWREGFEVTILYNTGNDTRKIAADMIKTYVEQINPKFNVKVRGVQWATFLDELEQERIPLAFIGWLADFPDPHNFVDPYMASGGNYGQDMGEAYREWARENADPLIKEGINTTDPDERLGIYEELQQLAVEEATMLWLYQPTGINVRRASVEGWYPNAMRPGIDFYSLDM